MVENKPTTKMEKLSKANSAFWQWATRSWYTRMVTGICLIIIVVRLATTCVDMFGIKIGCNESDNSYYEQPYEHNNTYNHYNKYHNYAPEDGTEQDENF